MCVCVCATSIWHSKRTCVLVLHVWSDCAVYLEAGYETMLLVVLGDVFRLKVKNHCLKISSNFIPIPQGNPEMAHCLTHRYC